MAEADKDGRIAQWLHDRLACLAMEMQESIADAVASFDAILPDGDAEGFCPDDERTAK